MLQIRSFRLPMAVISFLFFFALHPLHAQVPQIINYQGRVAVGTPPVNFNGSGAFKFALVNAAGTTTYWSNNGTSNAGSQPTAAVTLTVTKGLYSVLLGDTAPPLSMTAIPATVWANPDVRLRVWFNDGTNGSQLLTPDQRIASVGYAMMAAGVPDGAITSAKIASGAVTSTQIAGGAVGSTQIAAGAVQSANIAAGAVANTQLANSAVTVTAGSGLAGGGTVALGGAVTLSNAGVRSLAGGGGISVSAGTGAITLGSNATSFNDIGTIVLRDELGGFSAGTINLFGALNLPSTSNANSGVIAQNGISLLHTFCSSNFFAGLGAGNFIMTGTGNTAAGVNALSSNTTGLHNTATGTLALSSNTTGSFNVANGRGALYLNTTGSVNTATGLQVLYSNTTGSVNTASGVNALFFNTTASRNVAVGNNALNTQSFDNGGVAWNSDNVAVGVDALLSNQPTLTTNGVANTALGTQAMRSNTTGSVNTAIGLQTLFSNTTGSNNIASGVNALFSNTTAGQNVAVGPNALYTQSFSNGGATWNGNNVAVGYEALRNNQPTSINNGRDNTALGTQAMWTNTTGFQNTALGNLAMRYNTTGFYNTASGSGAMESNTTGNSNTASGSGALALNTAGSGNTASGYYALHSNTTSSRNVAIGENALLIQSFNNGGVNYESVNVAVGFEALRNNQPTSIENGVANTALGARALHSNTTGTGNTASGGSALVLNTTGSLNTAIGLNTLVGNTVGSSNTAVGNFADVSSGNLTNATAIGANAVVNASNKVRIGNNGVTVIEGAVDFTFTSDRNKKENFLPVDGAEVLRKIRGFPLTSWNYIGHDPKKFRHYGPMAQDFHAAFGQDAVGTIGTPITVNSGDMVGILMSAVQALDAENAALRVEAAAAHRRLVELEARLTKLEQLIPETPKAGAVMAALKNGD